MIDGFRPRLKERVEEFLLQRLVEEESNFQNRVTAAGRDGLVEQLLLFRHRAKHFQRAWLAKDKLPHDRFRGWCVVKLLYLFSQQLHFLLERDALRDGHFIARLLLQYQLEILVRNDRVEWEFDLTSAIVCFRCSFLPEQATFVVGRYFEHGHLLTSDGAGRVACVGLVPA